MVKTTTIMALLTLTYLILKVVMCFMSNTAYNDAKSCETNGASLNALAGMGNAFKSPYTKEIAFYTTLLQQIALDMFRTGLINIGLVVLIILHYATRKPYDKHKHKHVKLKISYYNFVTRPLFIAVCGIIVMVSDAYILGERMVVNARTIGSSVNEVFTSPPKAGLTLVYEKQPECISDSTINTLYQLAWASIIIFISMMAVSHWSAFMFAFKEKKDEVRAAKGRHEEPETGRKRSNSNSSSGSDDSNSSDDSIIDQY